MEKLYDLKKFNGRNNEVSFNLWKDKVWTALYSVGLEGYLLNNAKTLAKSKGKDEEKSQKEDRLAFAFVRGTLCDSLYSRFRESTTCELAKAIQKEFGTMDALTVHLHRKRFINCYKEPEEDMRDYFLRLDDLKRLLLDGNYKVTEADHVLQIMSGTQEEFGAFISAVTGKCTLDEIRLTDLCDQLVREDSFRRQNNVKPNNKMFMIGPENGKLSGKRPTDLRVEFDINNNETTDRTVKKIKKTEYSVQNRKCYKCGEFGHYANKCPERNKIKSVVTVPKKEFSCCLRDDEFDR